MFSTYFCPTEYLIFLNRSYKLGSQGKDTLHALMFKQVQERHMKCTIFRRTNNVIFKGTPFCLNSVPKDTFPIFEETDNSIYILILKILFLLDLVASQVLMLMPLESDTISNKVTRRKAFQRMEMKKKNPFQKRVSHSSLMNIDGASLTGER